MNRQKFISPLKKYFILLLHMTMPLLATPLSDVLAGNGPLAIGVQS